jgi:hypothetical protein
MSSDQLTSIMKNVKHVNKISWKSPHEVKYMKEGKLVYKKVHIPVSLGANNRLRAYRDSIVPGDERYERVMETVELPIDDVDMPAVDESDIDRQMQEINDLFMEYLGHSYFAYPRNLAICLFTRTPFYRRLYRLQSLPIAQYIQESVVGGYYYRKDGYKFVSSGPDDYLVRLDINMHYGYAMATGLFPYGGCKKYVMSEVSEEKRARLMDIVMRRERIGFIEVFCTYSPGTLEIFSLDTGVITTEQYLDGVEAGYTFEVKSVLLFQYADYIFADVVPPLYQIRMDPRCTRKLRKQIKDSVNIMNGMFLTSSMVRGYPDMDAATWLGSYVYYYSRRHLRNVISAVCKSFPICVRVDSFVIHRSELRVSSDVGNGADDGSAVLADIIGDKLGGLKYEETAIVGLEIIRGKSKKSKKEVYKVLRDGVLIEYVK